MRYGFGLIACVGLAFAAVSCGSDDEGEDVPPVTCEAQPIPTFDQVLALQKCSGCHDSNKVGPMARYDAPSDVNFNTYEQAVVHARKAAHEVFENEMPPEEFEAIYMLTQEEKDALYLWALCGTPGPAPVM